MTWMVMSREDGKDAHEEGMGMDAHEEGRWHGWS